MISGLKYFEIMDHELKYRDGKSPFEGTPKERCEREHDWVLLLFARSEKLQQAAGRVADRLEPESPGWLRAMILSGRGNINPAKLGYLTVMGALDMLTCLYPTPTNEVFK
jgi:hypothetical protein